MNWPPREPQHEPAVRALGALIDTAKEMLIVDLKSLENLDPQERKIAQSITRNNTSAALCEADMDEAADRRLVVSLETTTRRNLFKAFQRLKAAPMEHPFGLPMHITHGAVNSMTKKEVITLSNLLVTDFRTFLEEQHDFAEQAGAPADELEAMTLEAFDQRLRDIHALIRERALPTKTQCKVLVDA